MSQSSRVDEQSPWQIAVAEGVFVAVAAIIIYFRHSLGQIAFVLPFATQAAIGVSAGAVLGSLIGALLLRSPLRESVLRGVLPLRAVAGAVWSIVFVGLLAGFGEELLFRAALQPWIGMGWAAVLFGLAHSGTARMHEGVTIGKAAYLVLTIAAGVLLGLLYQSAGLLASMTAHASFDIGILLVLAPAIATESSRR